MSVSLPSREVYVVDVPEVRNFSGRFQYNFFTSDESVNETGGYSSKVLQRNSSEIDSAFLQFSSTRAPRYVLFNFTPVILSDSDGKLTELDAKKNVHKHGNIDRGIVSNNVDKIVTEDDFANGNYISIGFHDAELMNKAYYLVSGSIENHALEQKNASNAKLGASLSSVLPGYVKSTFIMNALSNLKTSAGAEFYQKEGARIPNKLPTFNVGQLSQLGRGILKKTDAFKHLISRVILHSQINGKFFHDIIDRTISDPSAPFGDELVHLHKVSKKIQSAAKLKTNLQINDAEFKTSVPYVSAISQKMTQQSMRNAVETVGYLIDKVEITRDGDVINHPSIPVDGRHIHMTADFRVKYGSTYVYSIRTIAKFTLSAINDETNEAAMIQVLVSSKPSEKVSINTYEEVPPPPPVDVKFTWDYERDKLMIHWAFPPNPQRDIKKFQVFRRKSVNEPFELIKMYDFDDSYVRYENAENPDAKLIEYLTTSATSYIDDDFDRFNNKSNKFIYAIASVDAHGLSSNYSAQFEVWFDQFKNKLQLNLISHSGAPKPYPNLYLNTDLFIDAMKVSGDDSKRMKIYFNPEYYFITDNFNRQERTFESNQTSGDYRLLLMNVDNQQSKILTVKIDDQLFYDKGNSSIKKYLFGNLNKKSGTGK